MRHVERNLHRLKPTCGVKKCVVITTASLMLQGEVEVKGSMTWKCEMFGWNWVEQAEGDCVLRPAEWKRKNIEKKRVTPVWDYGCGSRPASIGLSFSHKDLWQLQFQSEARGSFLNVNKWTYSNITFLPSHCFYIYIYKNVYIYIYMHIYMYIYIDFFLT